YSLRWLVYTIPIYKINRQEYNLLVDFSGNLELSFLDRYFSLARILVAGIIWNIIFIIYN
ncbi:MAG: hypothetical protein WD512_08495, partial [Candidatus Paceibacterota bacterium]